MMNSSDNAYSFDVDPEQKDAFNTEEALMAKMEKLKQSLDRLHKQVQHMPGVIRYTRTSTGSHNRYGIFPLPTIGLDGTVMMKGSEYTVGLFWNTSISMTREEVDADSRVKARQLHKISHMSQQIANQYKVYRALLTRIQVKLTRNMSSSDLETEHVPIKASTRTSEHGTEFQTICLGERRNIVIMFTPENGKTPSFHGTIHAAMQRFTDKWSGMPTTMLKLQEFAHMLNRRFDLQGSDKITQMLYRPRARYHSSEVLLYSPSMKVVAYGPPPETAKSPFEVLYGPFLSRSGAAYSIVKSTEVTKLRAIADQFNPLEVK